MNKLVMGISKIFCIDIYRHCVFTIEIKRERYNVQNYDKSYKLHVVSDRVIDQNYYNSDQYEQSRQIEVFAPLFR